MNSGNSISPVNQRKRKAAILKTKSVVKKLFAAMTAMALFFAFIPAQAAEVTIEGVIVNRDGNSVLVRNAAGNTTFTINDATKIAATKLMGILWDSMTPEALLPGLAVRAEAVTSGDQTVAKMIKFSEDDLKRAREIQAALAVPQQEAAALRAKVKEQQQVIDASKQDIEANKQNLAATQEQIAKNDAEVKKRFGDLASYDTKSEVIILYDVNSANLPEKSKQDIQTLAANAKTYKAYVIQVAGYTDSDGSASANQVLSDRRAEGVVNYLRQSAGVDISRVLAPVAMSTARAAASNETAQGKAENRRVTVKLLVNRGIAQ